MNFSFCFLYQRCKQVELKTKRNKYWRSFVVTLDGVEFPRPYFSCSLRVKNFDIFMASFNGCSEGDFLKCLALGSLKFRLFSESRELFVSRFRASSSMRIVTGELKLGLVMMRLFTGAKWLFKKRKILWAVSMFGETHQNSDII